MVRVGLALTKHDAASAVADLRSVLRDQPNNVQALKLLAQAHVLNKEENLAVETLRKAETLVPNDVGVKLGLAELLARQQKLDDAKHEIESILAQDANQAQALRQCSSFSWRART